MRLMQEPPQGSPSMKLSFSLSSMIQSFSGLLLFADSLPSRPSLFSDRFPSALLVTMSLFDTINGGAGRVQVDLAFIAFCSKSCFSEGPVGSTGLQINPRAALTCMSTAVRAIIG